METKGRWTFTPIMALTLAINLVGWGITIGTILTKLDAHHQRLIRVEDAVFPRAHADERKQ